MVIQRWFVNKIRDLGLFVRFLSFDGHIDNNWHPNSGIRRVDVHWCVTQYRCVKIKFDSPYCFISIRPLVWTSWATSYTVLCVFFFGRRFLYMSFVVICVLVSAIDNKYLNVHLPINKQLKIKNQTKIKTTQILCVSNVCWNFGAAIALSLKILFVLFIILHYTLYIYIDKQNCQSCKRCQANRIFDSN